MAVFGFLGGLSRGEQLGDVVVEAHHPDPLSPDRDRHRQHLYVHQRAVLALPLPEALHQLIVGGLLGVGDRLRAGLRRGDEIIEVLSDDLRLGIPVQPFERGIAGEHPVLQIQHDDRDRAVADQHLEELAFPLGRREEMGVLQGNGGLLPEQVEEPLIGGREGAGRMLVPDVDCADRPATDEQRRNHRGPRVDLGILIGSPRPGLVVGNEELLAGANHQAHRSFAHLEPGSPGIRFHSVIGRDHQLAARLIIGCQLTADRAQQGHGTLQHRLEKARQLELGG